MKETPDIQPASAMDGLRRGERPTPNIQCQTCEFGTRELTKKEWETKISEPFRFFRVFRGQKRFYYPRNARKDAKISKTKIGQRRFIYPPNTLKDAKISKTKIGWFIGAGFVYVANLYGVCLSARLLLAILGDERSGIGRAPARGHPPVLAGAGLVAQIEF